MTPKEKAEELIRKYDCGGLTTFLGHDVKIISKQCAIIAVDETIRTLNEDIRDIDVRGNILLDLIEYWQEVKQEIEQL